MSTLGILTEANWGGGVLELLDSVGSLVDCLEESQKNQDVIYSSSCNLLPEHCTHALPTSYYLMLVNAGYSDLNHQNLKCGLLIYLVIIFQNNCEKNYTLFLFFLLIMKKVSYIINLPHLDYGYSGVYLQKCKVTNQNFIIKLNFKCPMTKLMKNYQLFTFWWFKSLYPPPLTNMRLLHVINLLKKSIAGLFLTLSYMSNILTFR